MAPLESNDQFDRVFNNTDVTFLFAHLDVSYTSKHTRSSHPDTSSSSAKMQISAKILWAEICVSHPADRNHIRSSGCHFQLQFSNMHLFLHPHQTKIRRQAEAKSRSQMKLLVILVVFAAFCGDVVSRNLEDITSSLGYVNGNDVCLCWSQAFSRRFKKSKLNPPKTSKRK